MAKAGDVIDDSVTGQRIVFEATAQETGGEVLRLQDSPVPSASKWRTITRRRCELTEPRQLCVR